MEDKFVFSESVLSRTSFCSYFVSWRIYFFTCKRNCLYEQHGNDYFIPHNIFAIEAWKEMYFVEFIFAMQASCGNFNKIFSTKSKKEDAIYMGIIYTPFLPRNLLCKNIYTMSSFIWSNELFSILEWWLYLYNVFLFSFLTYEVSYSKKNWKFLEEMQNLFLRLTYPKLYLEDQIFAISDQNHKYKFCNNLWSQKFLSLR